MKRIVSRSRLWTALGATVIVVVAATSWYLAHERERILEYGRLSSQIQAQLLAEHASATFRQTEFALRAVAPLEERCTALRRAALVAPGLINAALLNPAGEVECAVRLLRLSVEEINKITAAHDTSMIDFEMEITTEGDIRISIRLDAADGGYAGALVGILDQQYLTRRYDEYGTVDVDLIALYGTDNRVLASWLKNGSDGKKHISDQPLLRGITQEGFQATGLRTLNAPLVVASVFQLPDYSYRMIVAYRKERLVARSGRQSQLLAVAVTALLGTIMVAAVRIQANLERRMQAERELSEAELKRSENMRLIAGSLAHHVNNQMMVVLGNVALLEDEHEEELPNYLDVLDRIRGAAHRSSRLSERMLAVAGDSVIVSVGIDPGKAFGTLEPRLRAIAGPDTAFITHVENDLPEVKADVELLETALVNLVENAVETVPETGGTIEVAVSRIAWRGRAGDARRSLFLPDDLPAGDYVGISVADNGAGVAPDTIDKVFEPFFTTRFLGRGLGLSATLGIARQHGGTAFLETRPGVGTTVTILLPIRVDHG